ncbi:hypothetical protein [Streptomyces sp. SID8352]|uniref:hypothetical protein n=1 Tax=Streptomyces sp. SID8352 TaxID=2690338 RepID=UPI001F3C2BA0|nr:hypothetical protein [Streptomyces sp. SID8352]
MAFVSCCGPTSSAWRSGPSQHTEDQLRQIAAEGLAQMYFRANNTRAHGLDVEFTDVERLDIEL